MKSGRFNLLQETGDTGYPTEYLLSRIRGRRAPLLRDPEHVLQSHDPLEHLSSARYREGLAKGSRNSVWTRLYREYRWVFLQMNRDLRGIFAPYFTSSEIRVLIICLRHREHQGASREVEDLLSHSLLSKRIKKALMVSFDLNAVLEDLQRSCPCPVPPTVSLRKSYESGGLKRVEEVLWSAFLKQLHFLPLHPVMKEFMSSIIDARNIQLLYKCARWRLGSEPAFTAGGGIHIQTLARLRQEHGMSGVTEAIRLFSGKEMPESSGAAVQTALKTAITRRVTLLMRRYAEFGLILDYLWRSFIEAQNLAVILYGGDIDKDKLRHELVH